ncbi:MAG: lamin tail domain-containing protein, partial [Rhodothermales bacterium]|nr:lamin tail domain-containing protein [Rhodothermales bacterium]
MIASAVGLCSGSAHGQIIVNEFLASPDGLQEEFIELLNTSSSFVPLRDIAFRDSRSDWIAVGGDADARLAPGELLVLSMEAQPVWPDVSFIRPESWASLNNSGDSIAVAVGASVTDRVGYGSNARGISLERIDPAVPGHLGLNWGVSSASLGATPGRVNARFRPDIRPPLLRGAEFDPPSSLILWLSEPVNPSSLAGARFTADDSLVDAAGSRIDGARIGLDLPGGRAPDVISVGGLADFAGLRMRDTTLAVAIPS